MKTFIAAIGTFFILIGMAGSVMADATDMICTVKMPITKSNGSVQFMLYNAGEDETKKFSIASGYEDRALAIGLTAMALGLEVEALIDWDNTGTACTKFSLPADGYTP